PNKRSCRWQRPTSRATPFRATAKSSARSTTARRTTSKQERSSRPVITGVTTTAKTAPGSTLIDAVEHERPPELWVAARQAAWTYVDSALTIALRPHAGYQPQFHRRRGDGPRGRTPGHRLATNGVVRLSTRRGYPWSPMQWRAPGSATARMR